MTLYMPLFRSCTTKQALLQIHAHLLVVGCADHDALAATKLVESYAKFGIIESARLVFDKFSRPDSFMWGVMIKSHVWSQLFKEAISLYQDMQHQQLQLSSYIFPPVLRACSDLCDVSMGKRIHGRIIKGGFEPDVVVETSLLQMYSEGRSFDDARRVFDGMPTRDVVSWSLMISSCIQRGQADAGLEIFSRMNSENIKPDAVVMMQVARACADLGSLDQAKALHGHIIRRLNEVDELLDNSLVAMYGECGDLEIAEKLFGMASQTSVVSWTAMISCYNRRSCYREALGVYAQMQESEVEPNSVTVIAVLHSCTQLEWLREGRSVHGFTIRRGIDSDLNPIGSALINFYANFRKLENCCSVFEAIHDKALVSWNSLIAACAQIGSPEKALTLLVRMRNEGLLPDSFTLSSSLHACAHIGNSCFGDQIHCHVSKSGFQLNGFVQNSLIDMYSKCGSSETAYRVFREIEAKDIVTWNSMIGGFSQNGKSSEALELFDRMDYNSLQMDEVTFLSAIHACCHLGSLQKGRQIHHKLVSSGLKKDNCVDTALINMYAKCGDIEMARRVFDSISEKNVVSWSSMISSYGAHGSADDVIALFSRMLESGARPNEVTFLSVLSACGHAGLVMEGMYYFDLMKRGFGVEPQIDHCACVVDLLSRAGHIDAAFNLIESMPVEPNTSIWRALLNGCNIHHRNDIVGEIRRKFLQNLNHKQG